MSSLKPGTNGGTNSGISTAWRKSEGTKHALWIQPPTYACINFERELEAAKNKRETHEEMEN